MKGLITALMPIAVLGYLGYSSAKEALKEQAIEDLVVTAEAEEGHLYSFMEANKGRVLDFSSDGLIRDYAGFSTIGKKIGFSGVKDSEAGAASGRRLVLYNGVHVPQACVIRLSYTTRRHMNTWSGWCGFHSRSTQSNLSGTQIYL